MKKLGIVLVSLLFIPISVFAAEPKVKTLEASSKGTTINYNGTMEDGSHAVMCKLYDSDSQEIDLLSSAVDNSKFEGSFEVSKKGEYKVSCANYEGGEITEKKVEVTEEKKSESNPKTSDKIMLFVVLGIISLIGIGYFSLRLKKQIK